MSDDAAAASNRKQRPGLGRGLSALLGDSVRDTPNDRSADAATIPGLRMLPVSAMAPHPGQPRRHFDEAALDELAASIAQRGIIQPIVVRPHGKEYQIVAGERRWRASQRARLHEVPVIVRNLDDAETLEIALVENIQRQDLNAIEEADTYRKLIDAFGHTQEALGRIVGKSRSHVANLLRLLDLPVMVQKMVVDGAIHMGHARAILTAADPDALADQVVAKGLSVRDTERLARGKASGTGVQPRVHLFGEGSSSPGKDADIAALERQLGDVLGLAVHIAHGEKGGSLAISYSTLDQLDMLCQRLSGETI
ncbi:ParB/RepB/Spo0J family partition protein [Sphingomonas japonica]|uniref:ParB family chromosome partitioning protein n=1 Tax=Sphingomonas japonica TaxID=511662 RepID=A0ABX0U2D0_9SPHN|nr:ParB/RepB/Spo0J family partition protein [Sphingomonas japonica]NIJ23487.1 ParB family chromosome partitioning protein [Sphingomonas japonica]